MSKKLLSDLDFGGVARGVNHLDPVSAQDVATKAYVDKPVIADGYQTFNVAPGGGSGTGGVYLAADFALLAATTNVVFNITADGDVVIAGFPGTAGRELVFSKEQNSASTRRLVFPHFSTLETNFTNRFALPAETSSLVIADRIECRRWRNMAPTMSGGRFWVLADGRPVAENYLSNLVGDVPIHTGTRWSTANLRIAQGTTLGRGALSGTGTASQISGFQQGENLRRSTQITDATTTGVVATYPLLETTTHVVFTGSGTIQLEGATIISGKEITWSIDLNATVVVTFMNDGASTITQERFRTPTQRQVTIRAGESVTTGHYFNRHRFISVSKRVDPQLTSVVRDDFDGQCDAAGVLDRSPWIAWDAPTIAQVDNATSGFHSANHPGVLRMQGDAALADECAIYRGPWDFANIATFGATIMVPADGGNELLNCAIGFGIVSDPTDMDVSPAGGLWTDNMLGFMVRSGGASPGLWLLRRENAGAGAAVSSGVTVVAGTWATFRAEQTTPGSGSWRCYINGTLFTTATLANTSGIAYLAVGLIRGAGSAGRNLLIDEIILDTFELNRAAA